MSVLMGVMIHESGLSREVFISMQVDQSIGTGPGSNGTPPDLSCIHLVSPRIPLELVPSFPSLDPLISLSLLWLTPSPASCRLYAQSLPSYRFLLQIHSIIFFIDFFSRLFRFYLRVTRIRFGNSQSRLGCPIL